MSHPDPPLIEGVVSLSRGGTLGYAEYGEEDAFPLIWLHGTPGGRKQIPPGIRAAALAHGIRVITIERPGTGRSSNHRYDRVLDFASDIDEFADRHGVDELAVVGLSGGGPYTLAIAHELDRVRVAGVLGGLAPTVGEDSQFSFHQLTRVAQPVLEAARRTLVPALTFGLKGFEPLAEPIYRAYVRINGGADTEVMNQEDIKAMFLHDLLNAERVRAPIHDLALFGRHWGFDLDNIDTPVIFWHGDADHIVPYPQGQYMAQRVPGAVLRTVNGLGHFAGFTAADAVLGELRAVIDGEHPDFKEA